MMKSEDNDHFNFSIRPTVGKVDALNFPWPIVIGAISVAVVVAIVFLAIVCYTRRRQKSRRRQEETVPLLQRREVPFYKTSAFDEAEELFKNGGKFLCFHGHWGSGKMTTAEKVILSVTGRKPVVIENLAEFDVSSCADSVIIKEPFSKHLSNVENMMLKMESICSKIGDTKDIFAIFTFSVEEWKQFSEKFKQTLLELDIGPLHEICLNYDSLSSGDKNQILHSIFSYYNPTTAFRKVEKATNKFNESYLGYAETCTLLSRCRIFQTTPGAVLFCNRPLSYFKLYLERMCTSSSDKPERSKFVMLVFMSLNERRIDLNKSNTGLREFFEACDLSPENVKLTSIIPDEFVLREEGEVYVLHHDVIQRMVLVVFGTHHFEKLVRFSSWNAVPDWIQEKTILKIISKKIDQSDIQPILEISREQLTELREKCKINSEK